VPEPEHLAAHSEDLAAIDIWWRRRRGEVAWDASHDAEDRAPESAEIGRNVMQAL
jgi:hypothetical protein